jgi:hypothetical protein
MSDGFVIRYGDMYTRPVLPLKASNTWRGLR